MRADLIARTPISNQRSTHLSSRKRRTRPEYNPRSSYVARPGGVHSQEDLMQDPTPGSTAAEGAAAISVAEESNRPIVGRKDKLEELCVNTIRFLAVDAVEKAKSGHPGTPMGMADMAFVLWTEFLRHDPLEPALEEPRPLHPLRRSRVDAALLAPPPDRLSGHDAGRAEELPAVGLAHRGPSRVRPRARHRSDHRSARTGLRERRGHGPRARRCSPRASTARIRSSPSITTSTRSARTAI